MNSTLDAVLPPGLHRQAGPCDPPPNDYGDVFELPDHSVKPLQTMNAHPNDQFLKFYADPHIYTWHGVPTTTSVTALAHEFERPFVAKNAIQSMKTSTAQTWPRLAYVHDPQKGLDLWTSRRGALLISEGRTVASLPPHCMAETTSIADLEEALRTCASRVTDDVEWYTYSRSMSDVEIQTAWTANGNEKSHLGTERHLLAELFFNGLPFRWWEEDMNVLYEFCHTHLVPRGIVAHNTEKEIVLPRADLAGSIDLIVWDPTAKVYHIIDHKRTDKLHAQLRGYKRMNEPMNHLDDCKGAGYALQTSIYQYILETEYGMTFGDRILLSLHNEAPFSTSVPYLKTEVEYILQKRMADVVARKATGMVCEITGAPLVNAVRLNDGKLVMEKQAILMNVPYTIEEDVRTEFEARVSNRSNTITLDTSKLSSWRKLMPTSGIVPFSR